MIFSVKDYQEFTVKLSKSTWHGKILDPVFGHPEVKPYLSQAKEVIKHPDYIYKSVRDVRSKLFLSKLSKNDFSGHYLLVVVKYVQEKGKSVGYVSTIFITDRLPKKGKRLA